MIIAVHEMTFLDNFVKLLGFVSFQNLKNTADAEDEMIRIQFISGLRSADSELKFQNVFKQIQR